MYGLPEEVDLSFLQTRSVEMVCFAPYSIYVHASEAVLITIECPFRYSGDHERSEFPLASSKLMRLLSSTIVSIDGERDGTLRLGFSNGDTLELFGNDPKFEAYQIQMGELRIIV